MSSAKQSEEKCHCGRPLGHTGKHIGFKSVPKTTPAEPRKHKVVVIVEAEIAAHHATIVRLKREIAVKQHELLDAEIKLKPLLALLEAYDNKQITHDKPAAPIAVKPTSFPSPVPFSLLRPASDPIATEDDFEPIEADFNTVRRWAAVRGMPFKDWNDLPGINKRREEFELAPFKRKF